MPGAVWAGLFLTAVAFAFLRAAWLGDASVLSACVQALFDAARLSVELAIGLVGLLALWLGLFKIAEAAGIVDALARLLSPAFRRFFPGIPEGHPAIGSMCLNLAANVLGMDNAATPAGLKAMRDLQTLNPSADTASNAQILFMVLNASSVTLLPVTVFLYRAQLGASDPTSVFVPILLATTASTLTGLLLVAWMQRLPLLTAGPLMTLSACLASVAALGLGILSLPHELRGTASGAIGNGVLLLVICGFLVQGWRKGVALYDTFITGAKDGFHTAIGILPYLVAMLAAVGLLRASGLLEACISGLGIALNAVGIDTAFLPALPVALLKPFSGSGARALMIDVMKTTGADSFPSLVAAVIQGSTETTFYVLAVYGGAAGLTRMRHALPCALLADVAGAVAAILLCYAFFG
ncbi:MAG: hypothetical protein J0L97_10780 [Alphaproteobacteria bacterium]|nr:hypothetical protein [Alphaproteobacteria bacterium]